MGLSFTAGRLKGALREAARRTTRVPGAPTRFAPAAAGTPEPLNAEAYRPTAPASLCDASRAATRIGH